MFFEILEECYFPILFTSNVRAGGENQCKMIQDEQLNDSLANFESFRLKIGELTYISSRRLHSSEIIRSSCALNNFSKLKMWDSLPPPSHLSLIIVVSLDDTTRHDTTHDHNKHTTTATELYFLFTQKNAMRNSHWWGSTRMGDDQESVVDSKLQVDGVENLRVVRCWSHAIYTKQIT